MIKVHHATQTYVVEHPRLAETPGFRTFEDGHLVINEDFVNEFERRGWLTTAAVMASSSFQVFRRVNGRENATITLASTLTGPQLIYIKRHGQPIGSRRSPGMAEYHATLACRRAGVATPVVVAAGQTPTALGQSRGSFIMNVAAGGGISADRISTSWRAAPARHQEYAGLRRELAESIGETVGRLHAAGLYHQDLYWQHFYPMRTPDGRVTSVLIDLQRVHHPVGGPFALACRIKDLAQMRFSMEWVGLSPSEIDTFYDVYFAFFSSSRLPLLRHTSLRQLARLYAAKRIARLRRRRALRRNSGLGDDVEFGGDSSPVSIPQMPFSPWACSQQIGGNDAEPVRPLLSKAS